MMVSQMQMLVMAAGPDAIRKPLAATHPDRELLLNLLGAIERSPTPGRSAPGEASPSHTGN
jgi:hypothetical protein